MFGKQDVTSKVKGSYWLYLAIDEVLEGFNRITDLEVNKTKTNGDWW